MSTPENNLNNLFDTASKTFNKTPEPPKKKRRSKVHVPPRVDIDNETKDAVTKIKEMKMLLSLQLREAFQKMGYVNQDFFEYIKNPENFSEETWQRLKEFEKQFMRKLEGDNSVVLSTPVVKSKKALLKDEKVRKGKTLGSRRNWIPVR